MQPFSMFSSNYLHISIVIYYFQMLGGNEFNLRFGVEYSTWILRCEYSMITVHFKKLLDQGKCRYYFLNIFWFILVILKIHETWRKWLEFIYLIFKLPKNRKIWKSTVGHLKEKLNIFLNWSAWINNSIQFVNFTYYFEVFWRSSGLSATIIKNGSIFRISIENKYQSSWLIS